MRKRISLSVASAVAAFCVFMLNSCVVAELINDGTTYYDAEITTYGNLVVTGRIGGQRSSQLPCGAKKISIKTENGREKIKSEQIKYLTLSRKKHPDNQHCVQKDNEYIQAQWNQFPLNKEPKDFPGTL